MPFFHSESISLVTLGLPCNAYFPIVVQSLYSMYINKLCVIFQFHYNIQCNPIPPSSTCSRFPSASCGHLPDCCSGPAQPDVLPAVFHSSGPHHLQHISVHSVRTYMHQWRWLCTLYNYVTNTAHILYWLKWYPPVACSCWLPVEGGVIAAFLIPMGIILVVRIILSLRSVCTGQMCCVYLQWTCCTVLCCSV